MSYGLELTALIAERGEEPELLAVEGSGHDACRLYRFSDGTDVVETNAGLVGEDDEGFDKLRRFLMIGE